MLKIKCISKGQKRKKIFRLIVVNALKRLHNPGIEKIGYYNRFVPKDNPYHIHVDLPRYEYWISIGAQPTKRVTQIINLLR